MLATVKSGGVFGIEGFTVLVEADLRRSMDPRFEMVGLPETSVRESQVRVRAALRNSEVELPPAVITVNLAPADCRKKGTLLDLPVALGVMASLERVPTDRLAETLVVGELALDGGVRPIPGVLPLALHARNQGLRAIMVPRRNAVEAATVPGILVVPVGTLSEAIAWFRGGDAPAVPSCPRAERSSGFDFAEVRGQLVARRAAEVAAAGAHNLLMVGPPGCGKTMIARRMPSILPPLEREEAIEISGIWSVAGLLPADAGRVTERPFRAPHHSLSEAAMVGGGLIPMPGEASLAHHGVLFLDELPEFRRKVLESLRQPLEDGSVVIVRGMRRATFPCRAMVVASMNPCPCGWLGTGQRPCRCSARAVLAYRSRISGPLLDRLDLTVELSAVRYDELSVAPPSTTSAEIRRRVVAARARQMARQGADGVLWNGAMGAAQLRAYATPDVEGQRLLEVAMARLGLSARSVSRVLKVARTIADLDAEEAVRAPHVAEAIQYRRMDRREMAA